MTRRLVHVTTVSWSLFFIRGQARNMRARGLQVTVVSSPDSALQAFAASEGVAHHGVEMRRAISPLQDIRSTVEMCVAFRKIRPHIVHAHTPKGGLVGMISSWIARVPIRVYHIRGLPYITATGMRRRLLRWSEKVSCLLADEVLCVSDSIRRYAIEDGLIAPEKIRVLLGGSGNGVDASGRFNPARYDREIQLVRRRELGIGVHDPVLGYVGRIVRDKGIEELSSAWWSLREHYLRLHLVLVGPLEPQDPVSAATLERLQSDPRVHFVGDISDPAPWYSMFDLVALPTYREGFPNVPLEAAAMEVPVVATNVPGCVDAVKDGVTGTLIPVRDSDALRIAIARYLDDPELKTLHGEAGRERVLKEFRQEDIWEAIYQEYCRLLRANGM